MVTIKVRNHMYAYRNRYAYPISEFLTYTGEVIPNPKYVGSDEICLTTDDLHFKFRRIRKCDIVGTATEGVQTPSKVRAWSVPGSKPGSSYSVRFDGKHWSCDCVGFSFRKTCKHVNETKAHALAA